MSAPAETRAVAAAPEPAPSAGTIESVSTEPGVYPIPGSPTLIAPTPPVPFNVAMSTAGFCRAANSAEAAGGGDGAVTRGGTSYLPEPGKELDGDQGHERCRPGKPGRGAHHEDMVDRHGRPSFLDHEVAGWPRPCRRGTTRFRVSCGR